MSPVPPGRKRYEYDPRLDPQLQWAGKAEHLTFDVETVPLHIHERIAPAAIVDSLRTGPVQRSLFADPEFDLNQAIEFYQHPQPWANRLVLGDSLLVMNSLLEREVMAGKVQCIYFDPPYGTKYRSNFQPFTNKRDVKEGDDKSLTREPEQIRAFRDTWELDVHSYLTYLRDRLLLMREMLANQGSIFVQISDDHMHQVRAVMDEVFGAQNCCAVITFTKTSGQTKTLIPVVADFLLWYAKDREQVKFRQLYEPKTLGGEGATEYFYLELPEGEMRRLTEDEIVNPSLLPEGAKVFATDSIVSDGFSGENSADIQLEHAGKIYTLRCGSNRHWKQGVEGTKRLWEVGRLLRREGLRIYKRYFDDFPYIPLKSVWTDTRGEADMIYVVQTSTKVIQRCLLMTTDPGDLVFDPTCGSGTTAYVAEQWGRRWITCDTSRVALALARQRLMTATFSYYKLAHPDQGVRGAFSYKQVPVRVHNIVNPECSSIDGQKLTTS
jgi:adenine-specific DNA-methyltransferase